MTSEHDLDADLDRLHQLPLAAFVAERDRLASALRKAGRGDAAARIKTLAKPSVSAWAVNQAWWTARATFDEMLEAGVRLRAAQEASLAGRNADLRTAVEARQDAVNAVVDVAVQALGGAERGIRQRIAATCDALAVGALPEGVVPGRLSQDLQPGGFSTLSAFLPLVGKRADAGSPPPAAAAPHSEPALAPERDPAAASTISGRERVVSLASVSQRRREEAAARAQDARRAAEAAVERARTDLASVEGDLASAQAEASARSGGHEAAAARVTTLELELAKAREEELVARRGLAEANRRVTAMTSSREGAQRVLERAERLLRGLGDA